MTKFEEVSNETFDEVFASCKTDVQTIYGTEYDKSYELLDKAREYAHYIFPTKQEAMEYLRRKYPKYAISQQMNLFEEVSG